MEKSSLVICALADLQDPGTCEFSIGAGDWPLRGFVVRIQGQVRAYVNRCPHAGHALNWKPNSFFRPGGSLLLCASHGALFEPGSGECVAGPCVGQSLHALTVEVVDTHVVLRNAAEELENFSSQH